MNARFGDIFSITLVFAFTYAFMSIQLVLANLRFTLSRLISNVAAPGQQSMFKRIIGSRGSGEKARKRQGPREYLVFHYVIAGKGHVT